MVKGKCAVVTGSTSGIGLGIARALARAGCNVMLNGFGEASAIEALRQGLADECGVTVAYNAADLSQPAACAHLVNDAEARLGAVDILVNNAGIQFVAPIEDFPPEKWDAILAVNLSASFHTIRVAAPAMKRRGWGRIVNIASAHGLVASADKSAYVASKHGLIGLTKVVALELAPTAVTCNAVCPGWVLTPLVEAQIAARAKESGTSIDAAGRALLCEKQPSGRFTTPEQLGAFVLFLCSGAGDNITGASLTMDGGWTAQ